MGQFINFIALLGVLFITMKGFGLLIVCTMVNLLAYLLIGSGALWLTVPAAVAVLGIYLYNLIR